VAFDPTLDEIVLFELPSRGLAERLLGHIAQERLSWLQTGDGAAVVGVLLNPRKFDLAELLRSIQGWLQQTTLAAIRFEVDGRVYVLEARQPALAAG
jgi:hypothetical protein